MPATSAVASTIASRALAGDGGPVTARDVHTFALSQFALWCDAFAPAEKKDPLDEYAQMLFQQGRDHEARVLASRFPAALRVEATSEEGAFLAALEAMARGVDALTQAPLLWRPEGLRGRADVLERRDDAASVFGDHHYIVKEIKLAKSIEAHHVLQASLYNRMLGAIQGFTPAHVHIIDRDGVESAHAYDEPLLLATLEAVRAIRAGRIRPAPVYGHGAWPWESYTNEQAVAARDCSLVAGVGAAMRRKLVAAGCATVDAVAAADEAALVAIRGVGDKTARRLRTNARAIVEGTHIPLARPTFPEKPTEIFLDLEGTGAQLSDEGLVEVDYLIGAWVRRGGHEEYLPFLAQTPEEEGEMFHRFVAWLAAQDDPVIYHWSAYETTHLKRLAERHGLEASMGARVFGPMRDLLKDARASFAFPTYGNSIKQIAPYAGFRWRHKGVGAMTSIAHYFAYVQDPLANLDRLQLVLDYNEDDCLAMRVVKDWMVAQDASVTSG